MRNKIADKTNMCATSLALRQCAGQRPVLRPGCITPRPNPPNPAEESVHLHKRRCSEPIVPVRITAAIQALTGLDFCRSRLKRQLLLKRQHERTQRHNKQRRTTTHSHATYLLCVVFCLLTIQHTQSLHYISMT